MDVGLQTNSQQQRLICFFFLIFQDKSTGQVVLDVVFRHLNLLETAYFGLRYLDQEGQTVSDERSRISRNDI